MLGQLLSLRLSRHLRLDIGDNLQEGFVLTAVSLLVNDWTEDSSGCASQRQVISCDYM